MKKFVAVLTVFFLFPLTATAAERPTSVASCANPTSKARTPGTLKQPKSVDKKLATTMTINTNCGVIKIAMNPAAPQTVTNMSALARAKYFDKSFCHRLTTEGIFVLQCGDPSAQGNGSPGSWKGYKNENVPKVTGINFPAGTVAMANSGPDTNGSQFFICLGDQLGLPKQYSLFGTTVAGLDVVKTISVGDVMTSVSIEELPIEG